ncbi:MULTISPECIES: CPBP family intramembrane glutamic endopeptidase [Haloarcula]|jgi:membrane protease YdiL (CAAX protease family)|uniref:CPBP family intramembrane metalloprotease n=2 Tax=Haloarcula TaxID=2237 RepID=A0A8J7YHD1_9EURY|nr:MULTISPECIES: type II CAAX endopeptidase family protein [Halomicroarcula]MBX0288769.1 CPBP family intramembrane metalloprotease [Halomicroarcula salinisoli]MBX0305542.1 CPBP family intramembrane metalloprotease [Halomicroarcula salinisoli]MDS0283755.1 CPBP family intramembrane metalloprotease [Halomicroarcula sp. S3CR25-11]
MSSISRFRSVASAIGLTYGSYVAGAIVILAVATVVGLFGVDLASRPALRLVVSTFFLQGVTFGGIAVLYLKGRDLGFGFVPVRLPDKRDGAVIVGGSIAILGLLFVASSVITALGLNSAQNQIVEVGRQNPSVFLLLIPLQFLLVGPGEELLFRGLVQGTLRESLHPARAIVLASALFASIHLFSLSGEGKLVYIGIAFVLALVLGVAYEYTDNLAVPAVIHGTYNAVQFAGVYLSSTGGL